jgi:hypothetical protein
MLHIMHGNQESLHSVDNIWKLGKEVGDNIHADQVGSLEGCHTRLGGRFFTRDP